MGQLELKFAWQHFGTTLPAPWRELRRAFWNREKQEVEQGGNKGGSVFLAKALGLKVLCPRCLICNYGVL